MLRHHAIHAKLGCRSGYIDDACDGLLNLCFRSLQRLRLAQWPRAAPAFAAAEDVRRTVQDNAPRIALVIGNTNYTKLTKLRNPGNDARLMSLKLKELGFEVIEAFDRDLAGLSKDVDAFAQRIKQGGRDTVSAVFYAGHGLEKTASTTSCR